MTVITQKPIASSSSVQATAQTKSHSPAPTKKTKSNGQIPIQDLWNPAMNVVWNEISPFVYGRELRGDIPKCKYDELFLQGGRACVDGDTIISTPHGDVKIKDFGGGSIYSYDAEGNVVVAQGCSATRYEPEQMFEILTSSGRCISVTAEHRFLCARGWISCYELKQGDRLLALNCSRDISSSAFLRKSITSSVLRQSYYDEHPSMSHEDALRFARTILSLIYRCSRDFHLCDAQLLPEVETFQDVLLLLTDGQIHIQHDSHADDSDGDNRCSHFSHNEFHPSTDGCPHPYEDKCSSMSGSGIYETLFELTSEIYPLSLQSHKSEDLACKVRQVAQLVLDSTRSSCSQSEHLECDILSSLRDMLSHSVADDSYSDSFVNKNGVINNIHEYIIEESIVSIRDVGKKEFYDIFVPFYNNYIGNGIVNHNSGKSYFASVIIWLALINDPSKNAVIVRKVASSIRKSCWKQMKKVRARLELFDWVPKETDMTITNTVTGQQIFFVGLDDEEKVRSITVEKGYISIAWFEEAKQFKSMEEIDQAVSSLLRGGDDSKEGEVTGDNCDDDEGDMEYMTILTYNPPKSNFDWINREAKLSAVKPNRLLHKSTYLTMPKKWIGSKALNEIRIMKELKPVQYAHMYLGKVTGTGREFFKNVTIRKITDEEISKFDYFNMGIDWGYIDPNVFLKTYIKEGRMYIFDEIYQDELPADGSNKYEAFAEEVLKHTKDCRDDTIWCDAQEDAPREILSGDKFRIPVEDAPKQGENGRKEGYKYFQGLIEIIIDPDRCPHSAEEFLMFESKIAPDGTPMDEPGTKGDHCPDCARYAEWENIRSSDYNVEYKIKDTDKSFLSENEDDDNLPEPDDFDGIDFDDE